MTEISGVPAYNPKHVLDELTKPVATSVVEVDFPKAADVKFAAHQVSGASGVSVEIALPYEASVPWSVVPLAFDG